MTHRLRRCRALVMFMASVSGAGVLAACSGGPETAVLAGRAGGRATPDARVIEIEASNFAFDPDVLRAGVGEELAITLFSVDSAHDLAVEDLGRVADVGGDERTTQRLRIDEPGKHVFYCTLPGHRAAGMAGTITIR